MSVNDARSLPMGSDPPKRRTTPGKARSAPDVSGNPKNAEHPSLGWVWSAGQRCPPQGMAVLSSLPRIERRGVTNGTGLATLSLVTAQSMFDHDAQPRPIARLTPPGAPADDPTSGEDSGLSLGQIQKYVWARYVELVPPPCDLEEDQALAFLHEHYQGHPIAEDTECFYYGILAFEQFFAGNCQDLALRSTALRALNSYRHQTAPDFKWDAVEDRYQDLLEHR